MSVTPLRPSAEAAAEGSRGRNQRAAAQPTSSLIDHSKVVYPSGNKTTTASSAAPLADPVPIATGEANRQAGQLGLVFIVIIGLVGAAIYFDWWQINDNVEPPPEENVVIVQRTTESTPAPQPAPQPTVVSQRDQIEPGWWLDGVQMGN